MEGKKLTTELKHKLCEHLESFISSNKRDLIAKALLQRTKYIVPVLENIYQPQNASAVVRTCDCLGIQELYAVEGLNPYRVNPQVTLGSSKWVRIKRCGGDQSISDVIGNLRNNGYVIVSTTPHKNGYDPESLPINNKLAIIFGKELEGLSREAKDLSDLFVKIPMYGFTESYNISVSAGIVLYTLVNRLRRSRIPWNLEQDDIVDTKLHWLRNIIRKPEVIEKAFLKNLQGSENENMG